MARRQFKIPFAATGDTVSIPETTQPDGSVSMQQGYGFDYERDPETDPLAKVFPRDVHNGLINEITASIGEIQQQGYPIWVAAGAPYPINAVVRHNDVNWQSSIANNNDEPGVGAGATSWKIAGASADKFNAPIATIASAAAVNLTTGAPDASQITISGSASISGFTVSDGRAFVVKFAGACTLVNSGTLVTGTGANIVTAAGDSCILRATASNTVEILCYTPGIPQGLGYRQTWQNMTTSRAAATTYINSTGRPIQVLITANWSDNNDDYNFFVDGVAVLLDMEAGLFGWSSPISVIVPAGSTYRITSTFASPIKQWMELR